MGKFAKFIIILVIIVGLLIVGKNIIVKTAVEKGVNVALGLPLSIEKMDIGLLSTHLGINNLSLMNPKGFPEDVMFHAPEIFVDYDLGALLQKKVHLEELRLNFDQFTIVKNADGVTNLEALKPKSSGGTKEKTDQSKDGGKKAGMPDIQIDKLSLKVGKVVYKEYPANGGKPSVKEFKVNISKEMSNVTNVYTLTSMIVTEALARTALNVPFDMATGILKDPTGAPKQVVDTLKGTADSITGTIKDKIKLPFGN